MTRHITFLVDLLASRVGYEEDVDLPVDKIFPEEEKILQELRTPAARWFLEIYLNKRDSAPFSEWEEFATKHRSGGFGSHTSSYASWTARKVTNNVHLTKPPASIKKHNLMSKLPIENKV
ncbi:hypothetical protein H0H93_004713 [Arthromyces matolae]|nr:hypothetical protein H0H93_004713 [Arthromyces matolae]